MNEKNVVNFEVKRVLYFWKFLFDVVWFLGRGGDIGVDLGIEYRVGGVYFLEDYEFDGRFGVC